MPSFDIVSKLDLMEVENAVNVAAKEIGQRFDFRGSKSELSLEKESERIKIMADDDMKLRAIHQVLEQKLAKRNIDLRGLNYGKEEEASGGMIRQFITLKNGLGKDEAKEVSKVIKESKLKVQAQVMDDQIRVTGKKIDDLQAVMSLLREKQLSFPVQFTNQRS